MTMQANLKDSLGKTKKTRKTHWQNVSVFLSHQTRKNAYDKIVRRGEMTIVCIKAPKFLGAILKLFVKKKRKTE